MIHGRFRGEYPAKLVSKINYKQNIHRTSIKYMGENWACEAFRPILRASAARGHPGRGIVRGARWIRRPVSRVLSLLRRSFAGGDHSSRPRIAARLARPTRTARAGDGPTLASQGAPSLFGLAPGGACHAVPVTRNAVRSYRTLSPLPAQRTAKAVCFLWRYPWARARRALPAALSPWSPDFPRPCSAEATQGLPCEASGEAGTRKVRAPRRQGGG